MEYKINCTTVTGVGGRVLNGGNIYNDTFFIQSAIPELLAANLIGLVEPVETDEQPTAEVKGDKKRK